MAMGVEKDKRIQWILGSVWIDVNMVTNVTKWVVDSGATRYICANRDTVTSYTSVGDNEDQVYLGDSKTATVNGKGNVFMKLTSGKTLALSDVLHVPTIRVTLLCLY
ncbi:hypothetical protein A2U01_0015868 [Trifolium medium]|uniref:Retrovirus-related Pol polyprotein from transposon TNT 1-94-like beta-barrel domain-containing protein n=1 Tax=Trifolium medium TaxID=97028 RepID=A0A392N7C7_9FABA|nr:hypothetical protein [Trifolium medium]